MQNLIYVKNLRKCVFTASMRVSVSYFLKVAIDHGGFPPIPFRIFVDVTIFTSSPMQHLRSSCMIQNR